MTPTSRLWALLLFLLTITVTSSARLNEKPDFAYPLKVIGEAEETYRHSTGLERMQAAMQIAAAKTAIDPDSVLAMPTFMAATAKMEKGPVAAGLLTLYRAKLLSDIYRQRRYKYDQVQTPLTPLPANVSEWSGEQFRSQIATLTDSALTMLAPAYGKPIEDFSPVISSDTASRQYYPTLLDFAALTAIDNYSQANDTKAKESVEKLALENAPDGTLRRAAWLCATDGNRQLWEIYNSKPTGDEAGYILYHLTEFANNDKAVVALRKYLADNPEGEISRALRSNLSRMTIPAASFSAEPVTAPGKEFKVEIDYKYTQKVGVNIYRILNPLAQQKERKLKKIAEYTVDTDSLTAGKAQLELIIDNEGLYVLRPVVNGVENDNLWRDMTLQVTPFVPFTLSMGGRYAAVLTRYADGAPVADAQLSLYYSKKGTAYTIGATDSDGILSFNLPSELDGKVNSFNILEASVKGKNYFFGDNVGVSPWNPSERKEYLNGNFYLSRPIYRPGETVEWSLTAVCINPKGRKSNLAADLKMSVILRDVNYDAVDTIEVTTDEYGRANGSFAIPEGRLTGRYHLAAKVGGNHIINTMFMVSDFKAPVFEVTDVKTERQSDGSRSIVVSGQARTYTGMSVANATVSVAVMELPRWRWYLSEPLSEITTVTGETDEEGKFSITINGNQLESGKDYSATVTVTSAAAETATANVHFTTGKPYSIMVGASGAAYCTDEAINLPIKAYGADGELAELPVSWMLSSGDIRLNGAGNISSKGLKINAADAPARQYDLTIVPNDTTQCDSLVLKDFATLYSIRRNLVPETANLIIPSDRVELKKGNTAEVTVGVPRDTYIYIYNQGNEQTELGKVRMQQLKAGFNTINLTAEEGSQQTVVNLTGIRDGEQFVKTVELIRPDETTLTLKAESWRDKLVPGKHETWQFTLTRADGKRVSGAMLATMYNHALDALGVTLGWSQSLPKFVNNSYINTSTINHWKQSAWLSVATEIEPVILYAPAPAFRNWQNDAKTYDRGIAMLSKSVIREAAVYDGDEEVVAVAYGVSNMKSSDSVLEEAAPEGADTAGTELSADQQFTFRDGEVLQAFWLPDIKVNSDGSATISFTTPDAIGTWRFNTLAWDKSLETATLQNDFVANKPLMAQANAPRFLRNGDYAQVIATVYNNSEAAVTATTHVEFFDVASGRILAKTDQNCEIAAKGSAQIGAWIDVPTDISVLGYRVKSSTAEFSDGEQIAIPVLESGATVIDTDNFVLTDNNPVYSAKLPENSSIIALQYCQNPVWDAVRSLPDLLADANPQSSPQAVQLVYGALTARGLARQFPEIKQVIDTWSANHANSVLISDLMKNEDIKLALLSQTPWAAAASAQNTRMARLKAVFDEKEIETSLSRAMKALKGLQRDNGGFVWCAWCDETSLWATEEVAWGLGWLKMQDYLPVGSETDKMADAALRYIDNHITDNGEMEYARLLTLYPDYQPTTQKATDALAKARKYMTDNWRTASTAAKAVYALSCGNAATAKEIMRSVREFATVDSNGAVSFPSVTSINDYVMLIHAFAKIAPDDELLDGMRQWIIMRTQVSDDLGSRYPAPLVAAVLASGSQWVSLPAKGVTAAVTVGGKPLTLDKIDYATGSISERLPADDGGKRITVTRASDGPVSYGSITSVSEHPAVDVKAASCPDLSIDKRLLVERDGKWIATNDLALGERARVQLLITVKRDLDYVTINDERAAALEPVDQLPGYVRSQGLAFYRENSDTRTRLFITRLPKGTYYLTYDMTAACAGTFASGIATVQSQYAPEITAHSGGNRLRVK